jgi:hypothetical protein
MHRWRAQFADRHSDAQRSWRSAARPVHVAEQQNVNLERGVVTTRAASAAELAAALLHRKFLLKLNASKRIQISYPSFDCVLAGWVFRFDLDPKVCETELNTVASRSRLPLPQLGSFVRSVLATVGPLDGEVNDRIANVVDLLAPHEQYETHDRLAAVRLVGCAHARRIRLQPVLNELIGLIAEEEHGTESSHGLSPWFVRDGYSVVLPLRESGDRQQDGCDKDD